jgi:hypothetical protein
MTTALVISAPVIGHEALSLAWPAIFSRLWFCGDEGRNNQSNHSQGGFEPQGGSARHFHFHLVRESMGAERAGGESGSIPSPEFAANAGQLSKRKSGTSTTRSTGTRREY